MVHSSESDCKLNANASASALNTFTGSSFSSSATHDDLDRDNDLPSFTIQELALRPDLIAVHGRVYDVDKLALQHPGGEIIKMLGGIDATIYYRTIHPFHTLSPTRYSSFLSRFLVGRLSLPVSPLFPPSSSSLSCFDNDGRLYKFDSDFATELIREVSAYFKTKNKSPDATTAFYLRTATYIALWIAAEYAWCTNPAFITAIISVVAVLLVGLNIPHEANHGTISYSYPIINETLGYIMDLLGQSKFLWIQVHSLSHHAFTNEPCCDHDATSGEPFLSFDPEIAASSLPHRWWWRYVHAYPALKPAAMLFFLTFYRYIMLLDVSAIYYMYKYDDDQTPSASSPKPRKIPRPTPWLLNWRRRLPSLVLHFLHIAWSYLPVLLLLIRYSFDVTDRRVLLLLAATWVRDAGMSLALSLSFLVSHNFEGSDRHSIQKQSADGPVDWYKIQVESSANYAGVWGIWTTGGLSHQIEHHLFPKINSAHFPELAVIIRRICDKHGVKYKHFNSLPEALLSLFRHLSSIH